VHQKIGGNKKMHWTLFVFKKKDETIDEDTLLDAFNGVSGMGADYIRPMKGYEGEDLEACKKSVTELKPAVDYLLDVKERIMEAVENFNPSIAIDNQIKDDMIVLQAFIYGIDNWKGAWFAISCGNGQFAFYRRAELAVMATTRDDYFTKDVKDMELVPYDFHY
jgi:hypothetical protein